MGLKVCGGGGLQRIVGDASALACEVHAQPKGWGHAQRTQVSRITCTHNPGVQGMHGCTHTQTHTKRIQAHALLHTHTHTSRRVEHTHT